MSGITTHVLDLSLGRPASGVAVKLEVRQGENWVALGAKTTDADGRASLLDPGARLDAATYRATFATGEYFERQQKESFYPEAVIVFRVTEAGGKYHVPLLLSPFGYSTYRGS